MIDNFKVFGISLFILLTTVTLNSAQILEDETIQNNSNKDYFVRENTETLLKKSDDLRFSPVRIDMEKSDFSIDNLRRKENPAFVSSKSDTVVPVSYKLQRGEKEINIELGYSPFQPTFFAKKEYDSSGRSFGSFSVRWGRVIGTAKGVTVQYQIEVLPVMLAFKNEVSNPAYRNAKETPDETETIRRHTYGFGVMPVGFHFFFRPEKRLKPFISVNAGFGFFTKPIPQPRSLTYNFIGDFGGGILYQTSRKRAISIGYRYFHISNINIGEINPGYNAQIFYIGYSFFYK